MALIQTVAPTVEPVTLDDVKRYLRLSTATTAEDTLLNSFISVSRKQAENYMKRQICQATWQLLLSDFPEGDEPIELPRPPLSTAESMSITYYDSSNALATVPATHYTHDARTTLPILFPTTDNDWSTFSVFDRPNPVIVQYVSGYSSSTANIPVEIKQWILQRVGMYYSYREPVTLDNYKVIPNEFSNGLLDAFVVLTAT